MLLCWSKSIFSAQVHKGYMAADMVPDEALVGELLDLTDDDDNEEVDFAEGYCWISPLNPHGVITFDGFLLNMNSPLQDLKFRDFGQQTMMKKTMMWYRNIDRHVVSVCSISSSGGNILRMLYQRSCRTQVNLMRLLTRMTHLWYLLLSRYPLLQLTGLKGCKNNQ